MHALVSSLSIILQKKIQHPSEVLAVLDALSADCGLRREHGTNMNHTASRKRLASLAARRVASTARDEILCRTPLKSRSCIG